MLPESTRDGDRVDAGVLPPGRLVADVVHQPVMDAAERHCELVADLAPERARLHVAQMMGVGGPAAADEARLLGDVTQVLTVAKASRHRNSQHALVDALRLIDFGANGFSTNGCGTNGASGPVWRRGRGLAWYPMKAA